MRDVLSKARWVLSEQFGLDFWKFFYALVRLPLYIKGFLTYSKTYKGKLEFLPCLHDMEKHNGDTCSEYFWQDLYVARLICANQPRKHVDIGSRVDGFVAHVASFREIEVFDIRPTSCNVPGIVFRQADLTDPQELLVDYCDSLSCLHALEHFGLGRYGDPINPEGYKVGLRALANMLMPGGILFLSVPVGRERVAFNAHRIFAIRSLLSDCSEQGLCLKSLAWIQPGKALQESKNVDAGINCIDNLDYALAILVLKKSAPPGTSVLK